MESYRLAYEYYTSCCERYGVESVTFYHFVNHLTEEQIEAYIKIAN